MPAPSRRDLLSMAAGSVGLAAGCLDLDIGGDSLESSTTVALDTVATGFSAPTAVAFRDGDDRPYVVDQPGRIYRVDANGPTPVADLRDRVVDVGSGYTERGLLGLAFHPEGDRAYVRYSAPRRDGTPSNYSHTFVLSELPVVGAGALDRTSERTLLEIPQPQPNHNAGDLAFGPDGYLYVAVGDGGGSGDNGTGHVEDWYDANAGGNGQDVTENLLGSILRIDVDVTGESKPYAVPDSNPLVGRDGLDEHYAWGLRNPWRLAFDRDRLVVADVGQNEYEEVDVVERGGNYGWNVREGRHCYDADDCPSETPDGDPLLDPVLEYSHDEGIAVVGGHVYRGDAIPDLRGRYVFGDWRQRLFVADPDGDDWPMESLDVDGGFDRFLLAFGADHDDELYVATDTDSGPGGDGGQLAKLVAADGETSDDAGGSDDGTATTTGGTVTGGTTDAAGTAGGDAGTDGEQSTASEDDTDDDGAADEPASGTPGFGVLAALLAGASALADRRRRRR